MLDWSHPFVQIVVGLGCSGVLGLCVWLVRKVRELHGIMVGPDGTNGIRGDVKELVTDRKAELLIQRQQREEDVRLRAIMETRVTRLEDDHRALAKRVATIEYQRGNPPRGQSL